MDVAFVINPTALDGLGATLVSMVRNCRCNSKLVLWFLCSNFESKHKDSIKRLLHGERFEGQLIFIDFDARKRFGHLGSLHGDWTTYGRLLIPEYIDRDVVLYLDADLIISVDILNLADFDLDTA
ncbi:MAG: glycosyltransferase family 8 protein, partial [Chitinophagaceae bacterium]